MRSSQIASFIIKNFDLHLGHDLSSRRLRLASCVILTDFNISPELHHLLYAYG